MRFRVLNVAHDAVDVVRERGRASHTVYDDFYWFTHFSDTDFAYGRTLSQAVGTAIMRFADADILPFEFKDLAKTIRMYAKQLKTEAESARDEAIRRDKDLADGYYAAINDPRHPLNPPPHEDVPPHLNFAPLDNAADALAESADRYHAAVAKTMAGAVGADTLADLNRKLGKAEQGLTSDEGVLRRTWYKHMIDAPGVYSGYGAKTVPGVREAIEQKHWDEASSEIVRVAKVLDAETAMINSAAAELEGAKH